MCQSANINPMIPIVIRAENINSIMNTKTLFLALILTSSQVSAWYGPGPYMPCCPGPMWGYGYGMGYMNPPLQYPTFNYQQTVIVQEPPQVIVREQPRVIVEEREVIREVCNDECERMRRYFNKR